VPFEVLQDEVNVALTETTVNGNGSLPKRNGGARRVPVVSEKVKVEETLVVREKSASSWKTLASGTPHGRTPIASVATFLINFALVAMSADRLYGARYLHPSDNLSFTRLGYVSHTEARFLFREPDQTKMPVTLEIRVKDAHPPFDNPLWKVAGGIRWSDNSTDFTAALTVPLQHSQQRMYQWRTSNNHSGEFLSPPKPGAVPTTDGGKFTFLSTSCIMTNFPYNPLAHKLSIPGFRHLARVLPTLSAQFMLFLGDFIYIDVPRRFGSSAEEYRQKYRQIYSSPDWPSVGQNLSWIHVLDDHEISNDWSSNTTGFYEAAVDPWHHYHTSVNPPRARIAAPDDEQRPGATYFEFTQGPASFFMLDTRKHRSNNRIPSNNTAKTMLGPEQLVDFLDWLGRPEPKGVKWKIVASSVPFTKNWPINNQDTWGGFMFERKRVLEAMWDAGSRGIGVVIVSGDRHEFAATKFPPPPNSRWKESAAAYEFSVSPLNQFASPLPTYKQTDNEDVMLKYAFPHSNPKIVSDGTTIY
jgi:alkaline phosphatase D